MSSKSSQLTVIGVGLLGGSFALRAREYGLYDRIVGCDALPHVGTTACALGILDEFVTDPIEAIQGSDTVLVATPPRKIVDVLRRLAPAVQENTLVMDVGSTKGFVSEVDTFWGESGFFVGAHPMAGTEQTGPEAATASLFDDAITLLTPTASTPAEGLKRAIKLWRAMGVRTRLLDASLHDEVMVTVSHLPHLAAYALCCVANEVHEKHPEIEGLYGGGFKDTTRIASTPPRLWRDVFELNRDNLLKGLDDWVLQLNQLREKIASGSWDEVESDLQKARQGRAWVLYRGDE